MYKIMLSATLVFMVLGSYVFADIPRTLNYQGRLMNQQNQPVVDGQYSVTFYLYDAETGGAEHWHETQSVVTSNGYFNTVLGNTTALTTSIFTNSLWLGLKVGNHAEMTPRQRLGVAAYAMSVADGAITTKKIADSVVAAEKIMDGAVVTTKLADGAVTAAKIADGAVSTAMTSDNSITTAKLVDSAVTTAKLADGSVTASKLALNAAVPSGAIIIWPTEDVPEGWLVCEGQILDKSIYPDLFAAIGTRYGGSNDNFHVPDFRGLFVRAWDHGAGIDPDKNSRTDRGDGTTGDMVGTKQGDDFASHCHTLNQAIVYGGVAGAVGWADATAQGIYSAPATANNGGSETRPANIAMLFIIKK